MMIMIRLVKRSLLVSRASAAAAVLLCLLTALYAGEKLSQKPNADDPAAYGSGQVTTSPISKTKITLRLHFDSSRHTDAEQFEGGMVRLEQNGSVLGLTPYLDPDGVRIKVYDVFRLKNPTGPVLEGLSELNELQIGKGSVRVSNVTWGLSVEVVKVEKEAAGNKKAPSATSKFSILSAPWGGCCITCPPDPMVCANAVHAPCGDCW